MSELISVTKYIKDERAKDFKNVARTNLFMQSWHFIGFQ